MLGGGSEREWLEPLDREGNRRVDNLGIADQVIGSHQGPYAGLNLVNPQPGMEYQWMLNPSRPRASHADLLAIHAVGGAIVKEDDPEFAMFQKIPSAEGTALDTQTVYRELVLVKIPESRMNERRRELQEKNARMLRRGPEETFVQGASIDEQERYHQRGPTRFRRADHRSEFQHDGRTAEISMPDSGVVKTEHLE